MNNKTKTIIALAVLLVAVIAVITVMVVTKPGTHQGAKTITVEVTHGDGSKKTFTYHSDAEYLRGVLEPEGLIKGDESEWGLYVKTVDGETADGEKNQFWAIYLDGKATDYGVDSQPVADGQKYELKLETWG